MGYQLSTTQSVAYLSLPTSLRVPPLSVGYSGLSWTDGISANAVVSSIALYFANDSQFFGLLIGHSSMGAGAKPGNLAASSVNAFLEVSAEL